MPTDSQRAKNDEQSKLKLERIFIKEINSLFIQMNKENAQSIAATGLPIRAERFKGDWEALLKKHYIRVQDVFEGSVADTLPEDERQLSDEEFAIFLAALMAWRDEKAKNTAQLITNTNGKQLNESVQQARELHVEQNEQQPTNRELAFGAAAVFRSKYRARTENIATTETQSSAESTKLAEAAVLSGAEPRQVLNPQLPVRLESKKKWITVGDKSVRELHAKLNGVEKDLNQFFETGGERLMYPGDSSLGATAKNIAYCRCALGYRIKRVRK